MACARLPAPRPLLATVADRGQASRGAGPCCPHPSLAFFLDACPLSAPSVARAGTREPGGSKANPEFHRKVASRNGKARLLARFRSSTLTGEHHATRFLIPLQRPDAARGFAAVG